jgi:hypothetical protein
MTYRGRVSGGVVVLQEGTQLANGTLVEVTPLEEDHEGFGDLPGFGLWGDRADMTDSGEASLTLRKQLEHRARNA